MNLSEVLKTSVKGFETSLIRELNEAKDISLAFRGVKSDVDKRRIEREEAEEAKEASKQKDDDAISKESSKIDFDTKGLTPNVYAKFKIGGSETSVNLTVKDAGDVNEFIGKAAAKLKQVIPITYSKYKQSIDALLKTIGKALVIYTATDSIEEKKRISEALKGIEIIVTKDGILDSENSKTLLQAVSKYNKYIRNNKR